MSDNPWLVENVQEFSFLNCPECVFKVKEEDIFQDHAVRNHSQSSVLFGHNAKSEFITVKTEPSSEISSEDFNCLLSSNVDEITIDEHKIDPLGGTSPKKERNLEGLMFPEPVPDEEIPAKRRKFNSNSETIDFASKLQIETLSSNMQKKKVPSDKSSKKAKICPPKMKHFKCSDCGEDYTQKEDLIEHMKSVHNKKRFYRHFKCLYCEYSGKFEKIITEHIELCHPMELTQNDKDINKVVDKDIDKNVEKDVFKENGKIEALKIRASNGKAINVTCPICDLPFMNKEVMEKHIVAVHKSINVICPICDLPFMNKELMENHTVTVHDPKATYQVIYKKTTQSITGQPSFKIKCNFCERKFNNDIILRHHIAFKHIDKETYNGSEVVFEDISGEKKAKVWGHFSFNRINSEARCVVCESIIKVPDCSTTAMHHHLLKKHSITVPKADSSIKTRQTISEN